MSPAKRQKLRHEPVEESAPLEERNAMPEQTGESAIDAPSNPPNSTGLDTDSGILPTSKKTFKDLVGYTIPLSVGCIAVV
jgi:hypothetical protein